MKKFITGFIIGGVICSGLTVSANSLIQSAYFNDEIKILINGKSTDLKPVTIVTEDKPTGSTYLPLRKTTEIFGKEIEWDANTNTVNIVESIYIPTPTPTPKPQKYNFEEIYEYMDKVYINCGYIRDLHPTLELKYDEKTNTAEIRNKNDKTGEKALKNIPVMLIQSRAFISYDYYEKYIKPLI